jgi:hypothetical protein
MARKKQPTVPDQYPDPFQERAPRLRRRQLHLLGGRFQFESNSEALLRLVDAAYAHLPAQRFPGGEPDFRVSLWLTSAAGQRLGRDPPPLTMVSGADFLGGATDTSNFVILSASQRSALVVVSPEMLRSAYHARYELIEFAVFTLAARAQHLVPLHGACIGADGRGLLLMGDSGAGKSTIALLCLLQGYDFLSEDSVFVAPDSLLATGVSNFLHVRSDSLGWVDSPRDRAAVRRSPVIRRRSGVRKFELDLRRGEYRLADAPLEITGIVFLSAQSAPGNSLLRAMKRSETLAKLKTSQGYAASLPQWRTFVRNLSRLDVFELRRGHHPLQTVECLGSLLSKPAPGRGRA